MAPPGYRQSLERLYQPLMPTMFKQEYSVVIGITSVLKQAKY